MTNVSPTIKEKFPGSESLDDELLLRDQRNHFVCESLDDERGSMDNGSLVAIFLCIHILRYPNDAFLLLSNKRNLSWELILAIVWGLKSFDTHKTASFC